MGGGDKTKLQSSQVCVEKSKNFFKPIVATSLTLALSASVAVAEPTLKQNESTAITIENLQWENGGNYWKPKLGTADNADTSLEHLWFSWNGNKDIIASATLGGYSGNLARIKIDTSKNAVTLATDDKGIQMGASGTGSFIVDFGLNANRNLTLDLQSVSIGEPAFLGNIDIFSASTGNTLNIITQEGGSIKGNLQFKSGKDTSAATVIFENKSTFEGMIGGYIGGSGNVNAAYISGHIVFEKGGTIDGSKTEEGYAILGGLPTQALFTRSLTTTITFKQEGHIIGNIASLGFSHTGTPVPVKTHINFQSKGKIDGEIKADANSINDITFYASKTTLDDVADATITGTISATTPKWGGEGINNIYFKNASEIKENNSSSANSIKAVLGELTSTAGRENTTTKNTITSTVTNLDLTTGKISSLHRGTTLITATGTTNTLTTGELYTTGGGTDTKLQIHLHKGDATNNVTISKTNNGKTMDITTLYKKKIS